MHKVSLPKAAAVVNISMCMEDFAVGADYCNGAIIVYNNSLYISGNLFPDGKMDLQLGILELNMGN